MWLMIQAKHALKQIPTQSQKFIDSAKYCKGSGGNSTQVKQNNLPHVSVMSDNSTGSVNQNINDLDKLKNFYTAYRIHEKRIVTK